MFRMGDDAGARRRQRRQHQRSPAPQVGRFHGGSPQRTARRHRKRSSIYPHLRAKAFKTDGAAEPPLKDHILDAAFPLGAEHGRRQQRGRVGGQRRVDAGEHPPCPVQPPEPGNSDALAARLHPAAHLFQNFQHRRIQPRRAAEQFRPPPSRRSSTGQRGGKNAVRQGRKDAATQIPPPLDPDCRAPRTLDGRTAAVQEFRQICDLRLPRRAPQHGGALGARRRQHQRFRRPHTGEAQGDLSPVEAGGGRQHQPARPGVPLHSPHLPQPGQMQIDGPGPDPAPAGQIRLGAAQLRQQRRAEQDGRPHLFRRFPRKCTGFRRAGEDNILPFPPGRAPRSPQQCKAHRHIRKAGHCPQPHPL